MDTLEEREAVGAVEAYKRLKRTFPRNITLNALYGLQAILLNIHWNALSPQMKVDLNGQVER